MLFATPRRDVTFEIPDEWWEFAEMRGFASSAEFYAPVCGDRCEVVSLSDIEPFQRAVGTGGFRKYKIMPVLFALQSPEPTLPPIRIQRSVHHGNYLYQLQNGFHRYYASIAVGHSKIPAFIE